MCQTVNRVIKLNGHSTVINSQCLKDNSNCLATKEQEKTRNVTNENQVRKQVTLQNPCQFPFKLRNVTYNTCIKRGKTHPDKFWCATTVNGTNHKWGYCSDSCPKEEDNKLEADEVAVKSWKINLVIGILIGLLLIIAFIITYRCIIKKKAVNVENAKATDEVVTLGNGEVTDEYKLAPVMRRNEAKVSDEVVIIENPERYSLDPTMNENQARINSNMILNDQAELLPYSGKLEIERSNFEMGKKLGGGSFGSVFEGLIDDPKQPGQKMKVAIKTVNNPRDESQVYALMCEIKVLEKLEKHPNLVNMIGACTTGHNTGRLWLLLEHCSCGDMKHFLDKNRDVFEQDLLNQLPHKSLNVRLSIKWGYGIAKGMDYLSSKKIMHGDLAARNILICTSDQENYLAKVTDFGLSKAFYDKTSYAKQDRRMVPWKWMDVHFLETNIFTMNSDIWSFGVVFWEMLSIGRTPYAGCTADDTIKEIKAGYRLPPPDEISQFEVLVKCYKEVTQMCWHPKPKQRSSFSDLVQTFETYFTPEEKENLQRLD
jgi:hypothetical protein